MAIRSFVLLAGLSFTFATGQYCPSNPFVCNVQQTNSTSHKTQRSCGVFGTVKLPKYFVSSCSAVSLEACRDYCLANTECLSFSFDADNDNVCILYKKTLTRQMFSKNSSSTVEYFNKDCFTYQTSCSKPVQPSNTFYLQVQPGSNTPYDSNYGQFFAGGDGFPGTIEFFGTTTSNSTQFSLDPTTSDLVVTESGTKIALSTDVKSNYHEEGLYMTYSSSISSGLEEVTCTLDPPSPGQLDCGDSEGRYQIYIANAGFLCITDDPSYTFSFSGGGNYIPVTIVAVPAD